MRNKSKKRERLLPKRNIRRKHGHIFRKKISLISCKATKNLNQNFKKSLNIDYFNKTNILKDEK